MPSRVPQRRAASSAAARHRPAGGSTVSVRDRADPRPGARVVGTGVRQRPSHCGDSAAQRPGMQPARGSRSASQTAPTASPSRPVRHRPAGPSRRTDRAAGRIAVSQTPPIATAVPISASIARGWSLSATRVATTSAAAMPTRAGRRGTDHARKPRALEGDRVAAWRQARLSRGAPRDRQCRHGRARTGSGSPTTAGRSS